ncbi:hypothetical protein C0993_012320 [Termitomyces sp. T159_Od127]|nr:hypothetical protein C0993_012320 [Termitomyces sp. T159_Od127]
MSGTANVCINSNPDVSGIGVRVAIYIQNFLSFIPAATALQDGRVTFSELDSLERQSTSILITALAILISTIIQAHRDDGITNFHASIVLNLSWMNNTNLFIYLLLYAFRRSHLGKKTREEDQSLDDLEWAAPRRKIWFFEVAKKLIKAIIPCQVDMSADEEAPHPTKSTTVCSEICGILKNPVVIIGTFHLSFMAAIGIWLWSNPAAFGTSGKCTLSMSTIILGIDIRLGSEALRIWSILVYSILLIPMLNLVIPSAFFAIFLVFRYKNQKHLVERHQVLMGLIVLAIIEAIFLIDTEVMLATNSSQVGTGETDWTFGQTLAVLVLLVPLRDLIEAVLEEGVQKQRRRLLLNAVHGIEGMVQVLLDFGVKSRDLNTLLRGACAQSYFQIVKWLLEKVVEQKNGVNQEGVLGKAKQGCTALHRAASSMRAQMVKFLSLERNTADLKIDLSLKDKQGQTALHHAASSGKLWFVKIFMHHKADLNVDLNLKDEKGRTVLHCAAEKAEIVKTPVKHKTNLNTQDKKSRTALHYTADGEGKIVNLLMKRKADLNFRNKEFPAFHWHTEDDCKAEIVQIFMEHNADLNLVNVKDKEGRTALHYAADSGKARIVQILIEYNADPIEKGE